MAQQNTRYGPYMTNNNAPAPFAATASQSSWGAFRAFSESLDDDITFTGLGEGAEQWVQIRLDVPIRIWALRICSRTSVSAKDSGQVPKNFKVYGSTDGITFEPIQVFTNISWEQFTSWNTETNQYNWGDAQKIEVVATKEYLYYRFLFGECQGISTQKNGAMTSTSANTVKITLIDLYQNDGGGDEPEKGITGIEIDSMPTKLEYDVGEEFDSSGLAVSVLYDDGSRAVIDALLYTITGFTSISSGLKTVTITYGAFIATFTVTIIVNEVNQYLNTTEGMEVLVNNSKKDDDTISVAGVDWFQFNGVVANTIYVSGNHWMGVGANAEQLKVCRRDGAMYYLYRQEGRLYNYYKFLKLRWEGYTQYNSTDIGRKLVYELFLFDTGDMFLNVVKTPTDNGYIGTSSLTCGSNSYSLTIPINSTPMITFTKGDQQGKTWTVAYEKISILPPFDRKYLVQDSSAYYTMSAGELQVVPITAINAQALRDYGINVEIFQPQLIQALQDPKILYWQDSNLELPQKQSVVQASPPAQVIYTGEQDMTHESISGIRSAVCVSFEDVNYQITFDSRSSWWICIDGVWQQVVDDIGMTKNQIEAISEAAWAEKAATGKYEWKIIFPSINSYLEYIKLNYKN